MGFVRVLLAVCGGLFLGLSTVSAQTSVSDLKVNGLREPSGIEGAPRFSWIVSSSERDCSQASYEIIVREEGRKVASVREASSVTTGVTLPYTFEPGRRYEWSLRVKDNHGNTSKAVSASFLTGINDSWKASWIGVPAPETGRVVYFRNQFKAVKKVRSAYAYVTSHGIYEASFNGQRAGRDYYTPGWTEYHKTLQYQMYDVTSLIKGGENEILVRVAPGWWNSGMNWGNAAKRFRYGKDLSLLMQIDLCYADGTRESICTDETWETSLSGPVVEATIYDGETINPGIAYSWAPSTLVHAGTPAIVPSVSEPVRVRSVVRPVRSFVTPKGEKVLDFGQNLVGWERAWLCGPRGTVVRISHAEVLDASGNFYTANLRDAKALTTCVLTGSRTLYEPSQTFYGFRYIRVEGIEGELNPEDFEAVVLDSGFEDIGTFTCSNPLLNQLQSNIYWGFRGNFLDIPTDCPQRDERLGWTGDAQVFFRTASYLGDISAFFRKWLRSLRDAQKQDGSVPRIIPDTFPKTSSRNHAAGWADVATLVPWRHYQIYGDAGVLEAQYESMKAWAGYCLEKSAPDYLLNKENQPFGDWLFFSYKDDRRGESAVTAPHLVAQCFFAGTLSVLAKTAAVLGHKDDELFYTAAFEKARQAFLDEYVTPSGLVSGNTQTAYVLALHFDLLPQDLRDRAVDRLVANIEHYKDHITTGFLGTPHILEELSRGGRTDVAYRLLLQETLPSWLYPVKMGATTIWERWDSMDPDGSIPENGMNSFNHYSYGAVGDWMYRWAGGIRETSPGYRTFVVDPHPGGALTFLETSHKSPYGTIRVKWEAEGTRLVSLEVDVPVGTRATVSCPDGEVRTVGSGKYRWISSLSDQRFSITSFGAVEDSTLLQTAAIQKTIDAASRNGGTVFIPRGVWRSGALFFKKGTRLYLEEGAVLKGSDNTEDYPSVPVHIEGVLQPYAAALVNASGVDGFSISGPGTLDGSGQHFWKDFWALRKVKPDCTNLEVRRHRLVSISDSRGVVIKDIRLRNSAFWNVHLYRCSDVTVEGVDIYAPVKPVKAPSTDGIDIDACTGVVVRDCSFATGDDLIAVKGGKGPMGLEAPGNGGNSDILIENCRFGHGSGALVFGSECIQASRVVMRNCTVAGTSRVLWLKMRPDTPQEYSDILVENISGDARDVLFVKPWTQFFDLQGREQIPFSVARNVCIRNCRIKCRASRNVDEAPGQYALENLVFENNVFKNVYNKDESRVGKYELENPLAFAGGEALSGPSDWPRRRAEILSLFEKEMYGHMPPPAPVFMQELESGPSLGGNALRRQVRMYFKEDHTGPYVDWLILYPASAAGPVPAILTLNYEGNHTVMADPEIPVSPHGTDVPRGAFAGTGTRTTFPLQKILSRGYAFVTACYEDACPDPENPEEQLQLARSGVYALWPAGADTGSLMAWAWTMCRGLDMLAGDSRIDASRVAVTGSSRLGKASLLAAACDIRFAAVVLNQTGGGGVPLSKRDFGEHVRSEVEHYTHWWSPEFAKYAGKEKSMPFDQHLLLSCIAPRPLLVEGFDNPWFDTYGEFLALRAAAPVWSYLGATSLPENCSFPEDYDTSCIGRTLGYVRRPGAHGYAPLDWKWLLDFLDTSLRLARD